jgi:hypothetical protein
MTNADWLARIVDARASRELRRPPMTTCVRAFLATVLLSSPLAAADLTGTWQLYFDPDLSGQPRSLECRLKQEPHRLTAACAGAPP